MKRNIFIFLIIFLLYTSSSFALSAMGVSPANHKILYTGQEKIEGEAIFVPHEEKNIRMYITGDLAEYVTIDGVKAVGFDNAIERHVTSDFSVKYELNIPKNIAPGEHRALIRCEQFFTPEERIEVGGAFGIAAIAYFIGVRVPNEGKFLEANLGYEPNEIKLGEVVYLTVDLLNMGTEDLTDLGTTIIVKDPEGKQVFSKNTNPLPLLKSTESAQLRTYMDTKGRSAGIYVAETKLDYGNPNDILDLKKEIKIGDISIEITDIVADMTSSVGKFYIDIVSNWNEPIENVYAKIVIKKGEEVISEIKTSSVTLGSWSEATLEGFWEKEGVELGDYNAEIFVYYYDKYEQKNVAVKVSALEEKESPITEKPGTETSIFNQTTLMISVIVLLAALVILNIIKMFVKKK